MAQIPQNPPFLLDSLYCQEDNYSYFEDEQHESHHIDEPTPDPPQKLLEQDLCWEDEELASLLSKEKENPLFNRTENNPSLIRARNDAVDWILGVTAYYSFSSLTSLLAVDYLDRFLCNFHFQKDKPWMTQLAAVACLSLAAKVEETQVPLLLDLQVEESRYVFEAKTIQRMEVLVLSSLQWRMNPVTPVSFLDHLIRRLGFKDYYICFEILRRCESLFISIISDSSFMCYLPSVLATATMLHVINGVDPCVSVDCQDQLLGTLGIDKDKVEDCYKLILELTSGFLSHQSNKRKFRSMPGSPSGVMDVCFSSDSSNDSWAVTASVSSSPEPLSKKLKAEDHHFQSLNNHGASDILSFPF